MSIWGNIWNGVKSIGGGLADAATGGLYSGVGNIVGGLINKAAGQDTASQQQQLLQQQQQMEQDNALWNFENITKPTAEMENAEWDRRFGAQNAEWERQWNMQNQYNSPAEQIQRLREAGINPAGMSAAQLSNTAADGMTGNPSVNEYASTAAHAGNAAQAYQAAASDRLTEAKARQMEAETRNKEANTAKTIIEKQYYGAYMSGILDLQKADIRLKGSEEKLTRAKAKEVKKNMEYMAAKIDEVYAGIDQKYSEIDKNIQQIRLMAEQERGQQINNDWLESTREARTKQIYASIYKDYADAESAHAAAKYYNELAETAIKQGSLYDIEIEVGRATKGMRIEMTGQTRDMGRIAREEARREQKLNDLKYKLDKRKIQIEDNTLDWSDYGERRFYDEAMYRIDRVTGTIGNCFTGGAGASWTNNTSQSQLQYRGTSTNTNHNYSHGSPSYRP